MLKHHLLMRLSIERKDIELKKHPNRRLNPNNHHHRCRHINVASPWNAISCYNFFHKSKTTFGRDFQSKCECWVKEVEKDGKHTA